ncbi:MAG TPA: Xaa-Pro dipeptidyl-peptidase [Solirubrobacteraceae bacterium]|nr:Xaa-Pro dipeptidyl-peptidase [Solirubrobacteraceae bacterium]
MRHRFAALAVVAVSLGIAAPAGAQSPPSWLQYGSDGATAPQFDFAKAIEQTVWVESEVDSDRDGAKDLIRIRISRPGEAQERGYKVPVVYEHSPYRGNTGAPANHDVDFDYLPQERGAKATTSARAAVARRDGRSARKPRGPRPNLPGSLDDFYVPRGYAVVLGESVGTFNSQGCPDVGADAETLGTKAAIDWLNGRARGFDDAGNPVSAESWTTGDVGMVGTSYNGTLPNQVATTGVEGLKTIIPVSAISSWYDYYRANGLVVAPHSNTGGAGENGYLGEDTDVLGDYIGGPRMEDPNGECRFMHDYLVDEQDRVTGDYSAFWAARDYLGKVDRIDASVFVVHGLNDFNVKTKAFAEWWYRLAANGVERKIWLHNGGHGGPGGAGATAYRTQQNRWFDHYLFAVANGIQGEPKATVQREDGSYSNEADWPAPGTSNATLEVGSGSRSAPGTLSATRKSAVPQPFTDRGRELDTDDVLIQAPDTANPNRLVYRTGALARDVRLSGTPWVTLRMSVDNRTAANLTAVLVDYGPGGTARMVTRGWMDPQNRNSLTRSDRVEPGEPYTMRWDLQPDDHVFQAGHRIGLVVVSTDHDYTIRPKPGTRLTLSPSHSKVTLPVVGGAGALR